MPHPCTASPHHKEQQRLLLPAVVVVAVQQEHIRTSHDAMRPGQSPSNLANCLLQVGRMTPSPQTYRGARRIRRQVIRCTPQANHPLPHFYIIICGYRTPWCPIRCMVLLLTVVCEAKSFGKPSVRCELIKKCNATNPHPKFESTATAVCLPDQPTLLLPITRCSD